MSSESSQILSQRRTLQPEFMVHETKAPAIALPPEMLDLQLTDFVAAHDLMGCKKRQPVECVADDDVTGLVAGTGTLATGVDDPIVVALQGNLWTRGRLFLRVRRRLDQARGRGLANPEGGQNLLCRLARCSLGRRNRPLSRPCMRAAAEAAPGELPNLHR